MTICLVTDRHRADPTAQARRAVTAGIDLIQIRERDLEGASLASLVRGVLDVTRGTATRVVVNDRLDVALACGADGVHLRADSMPASAVRRIAPTPFLILRAIHSADDAAQADGADYVVAGTVFPTSSKPERSTWLREAGLRRIVKVSATRVLAIGGISVGNVATVARVGATGVAAIGLFAGEGRLDEVVRELRSRFDSVKTAP